MRRRRRSFSSFFINLITLLIPLSLIGFIAFAIYIYEYDDSDIGRELYFEFENKINRVISKIEGNDEDDEIEEYVEIDLLDTTLPSNSSVSNANIANKYYYTQLDDVAKTIYLKLSDNMDNLKSGDYKVEFGNQFNNLLKKQNGSDILNNEFQAAWDAFIYDNPTTFFISSGKVCLTTETKTSSRNTIYNVSIGKGDNVNYYSDSVLSREHVYNMFTELESIKNDIISRANGSDYNKILYVHNWLVDNIEYDTTTKRTNAYNIYGALKEKNVVCEGYAKAFKYILDDLGIPCVLVNGMATNSEGASERHMWNYVQLNGRWYAVDVTWDDPIIVGKGKLSNSARYKYFLKGATTMSKDHENDGQISNNGKVFEYPVLNEQDYR